MRSINLLLLLLTSSVVLSTSSIPSNFTFSSRIEEMKRELESSSIEDLKSMAFSMERYHKEVNGQSRSIGGLHDYIHGFSKPELVNWILNELREHREISSLSKFNIIKDESCLSRVQLERERITREYLRTLQDQTLRKCAMKIESYLRSSSNVPRYGGLHDYISRLNTDDVMEIIVSMVSKNPELTTQFHSLCMDRRSMVVMTLESLDTNVLRLMLRSLISTESSSFNQVEISEMSRQDLISSVARLIKNRPSQP